MLRGHLAGEHEHAGADGGPEADGRGRPRAEGACQSVATAGRGGSDGLYGEELLQKAHGTSAPCGLRLSVLNSAAPRVSGRNSAPMMAVAAATITGYHRPR